LGKPVREGAGNLLAIRVTDHVVEKDHATHARQLHTARLQRTAAPFLKPFRSLDDLLARIVRALVIKAAVRPVSVWTQNTRNFSRPPFGTIQIARDEKAGETFEVSLFNRIIAPVEPA